MMIKRRLEKEITDALQRSASVALIGPRQIGESEVQNIITNSTTDQATVEHYLDTLLSFTD